MYGSLQSVWNLQTGDAGILSGDFEIVLARSQEDYEVHTLEELLPLSFGPENLKKQGGE